MERSRLIVKNFGPLKEIDIEVREMVTFIGAQASGKSTLAKLLSIFEDEKFRIDDSISFEEELKKYNILSYLKENTYISYHNLNHLISSPFSIEYKNGEFFKGTAQRFLSILKQGNDNSKNDNEEIFSAVKEGLSLCLKELFIGYEKAFINKISNKHHKEKLKQYLIEKKEKDTLDYENIVDDIFDIFEEEKNTTSYIRFYENIITLFPNLYLYDSIYIPTERNILHIISSNILGLINNDIQIPKYLLNSGQEYEKAINS
ncbi:MAG TPA: AAA family ATPase, partial [Flavobacterium sp.]|nr:AAA family ATPase [Flavobacterium sp.]